MSQHPEASGAQGLGCSRARAGLSAYSPYGNVPAGVCVFGGHSSSFDDPLRALWAPPSLYWLW